MTENEKARDAKIRELGCIACYVQTGKTGTPACSHHITDTGRRKGDIYTIPLCNPGHHKDVQPGSGKEPFHHNKKAFEALYGTQDELYELTNRLIGYTPVEVDSVEKSEPKLARKKAAVVRVAPKTKCISKSKPISKLASKIRPTDEAARDRQRDFRRAAKARYLEQNKEKIEVVKEKSKAMAAEQRKHLKAKSILWKNRSEASNLSGD